MLKTYVIANLEFPLVIFSTIYSLCVFESSPKIVLSATVALLSCSIANHIRFQTFSFRKLGLKTYDIANLQFPLRIFEPSPKIFLLGHGGAVELLNIQSHSVLVFEYLGNVIRSSSEFRQGDYPDGLSRLFSDGAQMRRFLRFWIFFWLTGLLNFEIFSRVEFKERLLSHIFRGTLPPKLIES